MTFARAWTRERPLDADAYSALVAEATRQTDVHQRYLFASLVRWHVPVPWLSWAAFVVNHEPHLKGPIG